MLRPGSESYLTAQDPTTLAFRERLARFPWGFLGMLLLLAGVGMFILYSAVGEQNLVLLGRQATRLGAAVALMLLFALAPEKFFRRYAFLIYAVGLLLLVGVATFGAIGMGARRWLDLGLFRLQPSEVMKVACILALARFYHDRGVASRLTLMEVLIPLGLILLPMGLIIQQPDLGTAVMLALVGGAVIFVAGLSWKALIGIFLAIGASLPLAWNWLHDYQRRRIITLFFPESDPLGAGYHIIQSKIAVGSGGLTGKGFMGGSQSHLDFLPERHTDFIFSVLAEEWGFVGAIVLILLYTIIILRGLTIAYLARDRFGLLLAVGLTSFFMFQVVVNIGMVVGVLPVVGIPLPMISYGGSSLTTIMLAMGLLAHVSIHSKRYRRSAG